VTEISRSGNWKWTERVIGMESLCDSAENWCTTRRRAACRQAMMGAGLVLSA